MYLRTHYGFLIFNEKGVSNMYRYGFYYARIYRLKRCPRWMKPAIRQAEIAESLLRHCYFAPDVSDLFSQYCRGEILRLHEYARQYYRSGWKHGRCRRTHHHRIY